MHPTADLRQVLDVAALAATVRTESALPGELWPALEKVVGFDALAWASVLTSGPSRAWPGPAVSLAKPRVFQRLAPGHQLAGHVRCDNGQSPRRSETLDWREYHSSFVQGPPDGPVLPHQVATSFEADARTAFCLALTRLRADFDQADVSVLNLLRPHLVSAVVRAARPSVASRLTLRERQAIDLVARGHTDSAIAHRLGVSRRTVSKHLEHAYRKLGVHDRTSAAVTLVTSGLRA